MSLIIFDFAYSVGCSKGGAQDKDIPFFSDEYFICSEKKSNVTVGKWLEKIGKDNISQIAFLDDTGQYPLIKFTKEFFEYIGVKQKDYKEQNIVFVNELYRSQCYQEDNQWKINIKGKMYRVGGFFQEKKNDMQIVGYINTDSENVKDEKEYSAIVVDSLPTQKSKIKKHISQCFPTVKIEDWNGELHGNTYTTNMYFYIVLLCGIILCVNCSSFANMWINSYRIELSVRKLVGASNIANHQFLIKEYMKLFIKAILGAGIFLNFIFYMIRKCDSLSYVQNLFGERFGLLAFLLSSITVLAITVFVLELTYYRLKKRSIMMEVRV